MGGVAADLRAQFVAYLAVTFLDREAMILVRLFSSVATDPVRTTSFGFNPNRGGSGDGAGPIRCQANDRAGGARGCRGSANGGCDPSPLSLSCFLYFLPMRNFDHGLD
ncbi:hypothetical protein MUK42_13037 [Musa troglodytarum]|uniref:Uncharacterized protein n=1 Tax=Musa troglodytarum TaxID=320322 RepID=A0A9E7G8Z4_9LILI|nr:hypothetical protein MUK42_13037 [Musa troglodytarum]